MFQTVKTYSENSKNVQKVLKTFEIV